MSAPTHKQILDALAELSERHPESRFGQLVENVAMWARGPEAGAVWDVEDDEFLEAIRAHLARQTADAEAASA